MGYESFFFCQGVRKQKKVGTPVLNYLIYMKIKPYYITYNGVHSVKRFDRPGLARLKA